MTITRTQNVRCEPEFRGTPYLACICFTPKVLWRGATLVAAKREYCTYRAAVRDFHAWFVAIQVAHRDEVAAFFRDRKGHRVEQAELEAYLRQVGAAVP